MYRVWADFKDGTRKEQTVPDMAAAEALKAEWESQGSYEIVGFELIEHSSEK